MKDWQRFEKEIAENIKASGLSNASREQRSGAGLRKGDISANLPFLIECKSGKSVSLMKSIDQAKNQAKIGNYDRNKWALVVNDPRTPQFQDLYVVIDFGEFLELLRTAQAPKIKEPDRQALWHIRNLKVALHEVEKDLGTVNNN
jgi:hypothetical protein